MIRFFRVIKVANFLIPRTRTIPAKNRKLETTTIRLLKPEKIAEIKERPPAIVKSVPKLRKFSLFPDIKMCNLTWFVYFAVLFKFFCAG